MLTSLKKSTIAGALLGSERQRMKGVMMTDMISFKKMNTFNVYSVPKSWCTYRVEGTSKRSKQVSASVPSKGGRQLEV